MIKMHLIVIILNKQNKKYKNKIKVWLFVKKWTVVTNHWCINQEDKICEWKPMITDFHPKEHFKREKKIQQYFDLKNRKNE